jgi:hypothetical protein
VRGEPSSHHPSTITCTASCGYAAAVDTCILVARYAAMALPQKQKHSTVDSLHSTQLCPQPLTSAWCSVAWLKMPSDEIGCLSLTQHLT